MDNNYNNINPNNLDNNNFDNTNQNKLDNNFNNTNNNLNSNLNNKYDYIPNNKNKLNQNRTYQEMSQNNTNNLQNNNLPYKDQNINQMINNRENIKFNNNNDNKTNIEMINNDLLNNYNLKLQEMLEEKEKEKEINSAKILDLQNLLNDEQSKNSKLVNEINSLKSYSEELKKNISMLKQEQINQNKNQIVKKNIFTPQLFIKLFFKINNKIFSSSEYKKYVKIYSLKDIYIIYDTFKKTCDLLKRQVYETHFEIDTTNTNTDIDENLFNNSRRAFINSSYRAVNERILKLKKFEFDIINLNEFVKNYLVSQEIIIQMIFNNNSNVIQFDIIEKLFKLLEDCLNFKIDEMSDNVIFHRKLIIKLLKSQKNCLGLSLEYLSS